MGVVILPPFSSDSSPNPNNTISKLAIATAASGIATIPSLQEYLSISLKDVEYSRCTRLSIPVLPYKVSVKVLVPFENPLNVEVRELLASLTHICCPVFGGGNDPSPSGTTFFGCIVQRRQ